MEILDSALDNCNKLLNETPNELIVMYQKLRILFAIKKYKHSLQICDKILQIYPKNADVLFDKASNLAHLNRNADCLKSLSLAIEISKKFKIKAKKSKSFQGFSKDQNFLKLIE